MFAPPYSTHRRKQTHETDVLPTFVVVGCPPVAEQGEEEEEGGEGLCSPHHASNLKHCRVIFHIRTHSKPHSATPVNNIVVLVCGMNIKQDRK